MTAVAGGLLATPGLWAASKLGSNAGPLEDMRRFDPSDERALTVAMVGNRRITAGDVLQLDPAEFANQETDLDAELGQLEVRQARARYDLLQKHLDTLLDHQALELEAKERGIVADKVLSELKISPVTDDEARAFYEARKARTTQTYEQLRTEILQFLAAQHNESATRAFYDALRAKHHVVSQLPPFRVAVAANGPSRGDANAPITIVEFADFQCPFCRQAEGALQQVMAKHPRDVRLVFRNLPFPSLHPDADVAAAAGVCARREGKFWPMHDAMFANQTALKAPALEATATKLGLDGAQFSACLADPSTRSTVALDLRAATELDINLTPYFFVNGRPISGSVPADSFESVIADELHRLARTAAE